jgi:hypothetical protein
MAHPNIQQRRDVVLEHLKAGNSITGKLRKQLAKQFQCHPAAIAADLVYFTRPNKYGSGHMTPNMRRAVFARDGRQCQYCGDNQGELIVEHIIPCALGGPARLHNLVVACQSCNTTKRRNTWVPRNIKQIIQGRPDWLETIYLQRIAEVLVKQIHIKKRGGR